MASEKTETSPKVAEKSNPPQTMAATATTRTSAQESTAPESSSTPAVELSNLQLSNNNASDASSARRLSDRALPPLPPQDQPPVDAPDRVITETPPPQYMSLNVPPGGGVPRGGGSSNNNNNNNARPENYVVPLQDLHESPDYVDCPHCHTRQKTTVQHQASTETNISAVVCCLFCGILPGLFPFCCQWFYNTEHSCPRCLKVVARMPHDGKMEPVLPPKYQPSQFQATTGNTAR